ncbi:hypothetical protein [Aliiglaciecola sp. M165]|uniref:hypothetical protein n=1 Tax=Aliiglaciecola sp. M165 TaxID=2593649 RepID=UPI001181058C|nr:hypothetical protein [Aliiglaciecola sp. M165]TRY30186.1 hypothetical protein FM019_15300 [Aliiglaciecola sp. M165]
MRVVGIVLLGYLMSACGGGGSSTGTPNTPNQPAPSPPPSSLLAPSPISSNTDYQIYGQLEANQGESVGFALVAGNGKRVESLQWQQLSGPAVTILAPHMQAIGFDVAQSGEYRFNVSGQMESGQQIAQELSLTVVDSTTQKANIRVDHAVSERGKVSLRIDTSSDKEIVSWQWQLVEGTVNVAIEPQDAYVFFDAPSVNKDEIIVIQGDIEFADGSRQSDLSQIIIKDIQIDEDGYFPRFNERVVTNDMFAYVQNSPYSAALEACVYNNLVNRSCSFNQLPLIGQVVSQPTVDDIMQRVIVSHEWMGDRFRQFLETSVTGEDMRNLLRAVTAVVISYDVRPSFYWTATGAIYLDAANFWMTPEERDTLNSAPDFRSNFGNELQFSIPWRYIKDNQSYIRNSDYPRASRLTKSFVDFEANISWLMYHELAHANDFFPPTSWTRVTGSDSPLGYANDNEANSTAFSNSYPLTSQAMRDLASVSFAGVDASEQQKAYTPNDVVPFFEPDKAPAYYSYSTIREDYATLFERFMMVYRLDAQADTAIIELDEELTYPVSWGQRNRVNLPAIQPRTAVVVEQILPQLDAQQIQQSLPGVTQFTPGVGYFEQIDLSNQQKGNVAGKPVLTDRKLNFEMLSIHRGRPSMPEK